MIINVNQATLPHLFVHYPTTYLFKQPQTMCCAIDARDEDQSEQSN
ncbi:MAG: hypothetical protein ABI413_10750 [Ktedonobacteraceae bacterium]